MRGVILPAILLAAASSAAAEGFEADFTGSTLRIDLVHAGSRSEESYSLDALREEGPWAGPRAGLVDDSNAGAALLRLFDAATNRLIFSRGFSTYFGEWRTTDEARTSSRALHETVLVPMPRRRAYASLAVRGPGNLFREILVAEVDPASPRIVREAACVGAEVVDVAVTGPPSGRLDLLVIAEGYTAAGMEKFRRDARRIAGRLLDVTPFRENRSRISVRALAVPSAESGTDEPRKGIFRRTAAGTTFNTFGIERYLTAPDNRALRDLAACAPYDRILVLVNSARYGGAGIHDQWAVVTSDNEYTDYVLIHEFGHALAGLGDEYFTSAVAYNEFYPAGVEPWEPNISALLPGGRPKWSDLLPTDVPVPTPPDPNRFAKAAGAFEGAGYAAKGLFRPALDCMMFSKGYAPFDPVCARALVRTIDRHAPPPAR
jgi:hypothetical protein